jgi:catechol 2,3-dioxygenase-like lactoylglutathione lyase family enzyme
MKNRSHQLTATMVYYYVTDMDRSIKFYTETLGMPLKVRFENHWAEVDAGPVTIGLHPVEKGTKINQGGGTISCNVAEIDSFVDDLKRQGVKVGKIHTPERGKFTIISDPDGNEIHIVEFNPEWIKKEKYKV